MGRKRAKEGEAEDDGGGSPPRSGGTGMSHGGGMPAMMGGGCMGGMGGGMGGGGMGMGGGMGGMGGMGMMTGPVQAGPLPVGPQAPLPPGLDLSSVPAAFRKKMQAEAAVRAAAAGPAALGGMAGMGGGMGGLGNQMMRGGMMNNNPLLAMTAQANPMLAMAMMGAVSNVGGIAGNMAMPKPFNPEPPKQESSAPDPDIVELFDHFHIDPRHLSRFSGLMEKRQDSFAGDMLKLWELLEQARSPEGMLVSKMREMETGTFIGKTVPDEELMAISKKFRLDQPAESKLSDVLAKFEQRYDPERRREYMREVEKHLETSAKPSATVMMLLKKLGEGLPLGKPGAPAPGCYLDRMKNERDDKRRPREEGYRPRSPGARNDRDRDRDRDRRDGGGGGGGGDRDRRDADRDRGGGGGGGRGGRERERSRDRGERDRSRDRRD